MYINRHKKPFEFIFTFSKYDSFKTVCLKKRREFRYYLRTHTNISCCVIRRMTLKQLRFQVNRILTLWSFFSPNLKPHVSIKDLVSKYKYI